MKKIFLILVMSLCSVLFAKEWDIESFTESSGLKVFDTVKVINGSGISFYANGMRIDPESETEIKTDHIHISISRSNTIRLYYDIDTWDKIMTLCVYDITEGVK